LRSVRAWGNGSIRREKERKDVRVRLVFFLSRKKFAFSKPEKKTLSLPSLFLTPCGHAIAPVAITPIADGATLIPVP